MLFGVTRDEATKRIEVLIQKVIGGGDCYREAVDEISVFGSYVSGALAPNDVDLAVEYSDPSGAIGDELVERMFASRALMTPFEQALRGRQRGMNIIFNQRELLERQGGFRFVTLWQRGEDVNAALTRLKAIEVDPAAGTAPREYWHPAIEGHEKRTLIEGRRRLIELERKGTVTVRRFEVDREAEPHGERLSRWAGSDYAERSPRRRVMRALSAHLEASGVPIEDTSGNLILTRDLRDRPFATVQHGADRLGAALDDACFRPERRSYCVLNLAGRDPFVVVELEGSS